MEISSLYKISVLALFLCASSYSMRSSNHRGWEAVKEEIFRTFSIEIDDKSEEDKIYRIPAQFLTILESTQGCSRDEIINQLYQAIEHACEFHTANILFDKNRKKYLIDYSMIKKSAFLSFDTDSFKFQIADLVHQAIRQPNFEIRFEKNSSGKIGPVVYLTISNEVLQQSRLCLIYYNMTNKQYIISNKIRLPIAFDRKYWFPTVHPAIPDQGQELTVGQDIPDFNDDPTSLYHELSSASALLLCFQAVKEVQPEKQLKDQN